MVTSQPDQEHNKLSNEHEQKLSEEEYAAQRQAIRENAKQVMRDSGLAEMLHGINKNLLKGRGFFEEYDSMVLFKWGTGYTRRHIWVEVQGSTLRFRLNQHRKCPQPAPQCDGEYHTFTRPMWANRAFLQAELKKYYEHPVAETSSD